MSSSDAAALHPIERAILKVLSGRQEISTEKLAEAASLSIDQARRGVEWLKFKNLASASELASFTVSLGAAGTEAAQSGLPERRLVRAVKEGKTTMADVLTSGALKGDEVNAAVSGARRNRWIEFAEGNRMSATEAAGAQSAEEALLARLQSSSSGSVDSSALLEQEKRGLDLLKKRPNYITIKEQKETRVSITEAGRALLPAIENEKAQERRLTTELITSGKWKEV